MKASGLAVLLNMFPLVGFKEVTQELHLVSGFCHLSQVDSNCLQNVSVLH